MKENFTYKPTTYWVTGLSGAGKSTLLPHLLDEVKKKSNLPTICFDGDELRNILNAKSFDVKSRIENGLKYCRLCKFLNEQGFNVVIAFIGLYKEIHQWNEKNISSLVSIFLDVPVEELLQRDPKGVYKFSNGVIKKNIVGIDIPACYPSDPDIHFKWKEGYTKERMVNYVLEKLF